MSDPIIGMPDRVSPPRIAGRPSSPTPSLAKESLTGFLGGPPLPVPMPAVPSATGVMALYFAGDFYYRIWVLPSILEERSPTIGSPIYFNVWNAYPWRNAISSVTVQDGDGLSISISPGDIFEDLELRRCEIVISSGAPSDIEAEYSIAFADGFASLRFIASLSSVMRPIPESPVLEEWEWKTDIMESVSGAEQRFATRSVPRRRITTSYLIGDDEEWRFWSRFLFGRIGGSIEIPLYQYATYLTAPTTAGDTEIYFDPDETDVRAGERIGIWDPSSLSGSEEKIVALTASGAVLAKGITSSAETGNYVVPLSSVRVADRTGIDMRSVSGFVRLLSDVLDVKTPLLRPGATPSYIWIDEKIVLERRPIVQGSVPSVFDLDQNLIDGQTGVHGFRTYWSHPKILGERSFLIMRGHGSADPNWWRGFFNAARGRQKTFLMPTWRRDFELVSPTQDGDESIVLSGVGHHAALLQFPMNGYLQLESATSLDRVKIKNVSEDTNADTTSVELESPVQAHGANAVVSLLNVCRLDSDTVKFTHYHDHSIVKLMIRAVDE